MSGYFARLIEMTSPHREPELAMSGVSAPTAALEGIPLEEAEVLETGSERGTVRGDVSPAPLAEAQPKAAPPAPAPAPNEDHESAVAPVRAERPIAPYVEPEARPDTRKKPAAGETGETRRVHSEAAARVQNAETARLSSSRERPQQDGREVSRNPMDPGPIQGEDRDPVSPRQALAGEVLQKVRDWLAAPDPVADSPEQADRRSGEEGPGPAPAAQRSAREKRSRPSAETPRPASATQASELRLSIGAINVRVEAPALSAPAAVTPRPRPGAQKSASQSMGARLSRLHVRLD